MADAGKNTGVATGGNNGGGRMRGSEAPIARDQPVINGTGKKHWVAKGGDKGWGRGRRADSKRTHYGEDAGVAKGGDTAWERETRIKVKIPQSHCVSKGKTGNDNRVAKSGDGVSKGKTGNNNGVAKSGNGVSKWETGNDNGVAKSGDGVSNGETGNNNGVAKSGDDDRGRGTEAWKIPQDEPSNIGETETNNEIVNGNDDGWGRKRGEDSTARPIKTKGSWNSARRILSCNIPIADEQPPGVETLAVLAAQCAVKNDSDVTENLISEEVEKLLGTARGKKREYRGLYR